MEILEPHQCSNLMEVRQGIDRIDEQVIRLLAQRFEYVKAASRFKTSETSIKAPERLKSMLLQRREWAQSLGLNPDVIEKMYSDLVQHFISEEMQHWKARNKKI